MTAKPIAMLCASLLAACAAGCDKSFDITFVNHTAYPQEVRLRGPGHYPDLVGEASPSGGKVEASFKVDEDLLPAKYQWKTDTYAGDFVLSRKHKSEQWVHIGSLIDEPVDENTEVREHLEQQLIDMKTEEVVVPDESRPADEE